jgi:hypothetical protein
MHARYLAGERQSGSHAPLSGPNEAIGLAQTTGTCQEKCDGKIRDIIRQKPWGGRHANPAALRQIKINRIRSNATDGNPPQRWQRRNHVPRCPFHARGRNRHNSRRYGLKIKTLVKSAV